MVFTLDAGTLASTACSSRRTVVASANGSDCRAHYEAESYSRGRGIQRFTTCENGA